MSGSGFLAGSAVTLTLHSAPIRLGTATTDGAGAFRTTVTLPAGVVGAHTVVADGITTNGDAITGTASITVGGAPTTPDQLPLAAPSATASGADQLAFTGGGPGRSMLALLLIVAGTALAFCRPKRTSTCPVPVRDIRTR